MKNLIKRTFSLMLVLVMCLGMIPTMAIAAEETGTISFSSTAQRTELSNDKQVWVNENITLTNNKAASTNAVADYSNPARFYAGSNLVIEAPGNITKIVFDCNSNSYATAMKNSVGTSATASSDKVTVTLNGSSNTYTVAKLTAQVRMDSVTVTYEAGGCAHTNKETTTVDATCTVAGSTTVTCKDCGEVISTATIPAGHKYESVVTPPTATEQGYTTYTCSVCGDSYKGDYTDALGETYTVSFKVPEGVAVPADMTCNSTGITLPTATVPTDYSNYTFAGWALAAVENTNVEPTLFTDEFTATADTTLYAVYVLGGASEDYVKKDIGSIEAEDLVVVTMTYTDGTVYALSSANGTSKAPAATTVTVTGDKLSAEPAADLLWNVGGDANGYIFYPNGSDSTWLYCTGSNNGVRVGTNAANTFKIDSASGYLKHTGTSRYLGVYRTTPDWRCYTNTTGNTANQTLAFYVKSAGGPATYNSFISTAECTHENKTTTTVFATCTEKGSVTVTCDDCDLVISSEEIAATGHQNTTTVTVEATCTAEGSETVTCDDCGETVSTTVRPKLPHNLVNDVCSVCGYVSPNYSGSYYIATIRSSGNYFYMTSDLGTASTKRYQAEDSGLTTLPESIVGGEASKTFTLIKQEDGTYIIKTGESYLGYTSGNSGILVEEANALKLTVDVNEGIYNIHFTANDGERYLSLNGTTNNNYFAFYAGTQMQDLALIPVGACTHENTTTTTVEATCTKEGSVTVTCDVCKTVISTETIPATGHVDTTTTTVEATCTKEGSITVTCSCGEVISTTVLPKLSHTYENGVCSCGQKAGAQVGSTYYTTVQDAVDAAPKGAYVQMLDYSTECVTVEKDLYLDLNGFDLDGVIVAEGATLYGVDSTTDDYDCSNGYGTISEYSGTVAPAYRATVNGKVRRYVTYDEDGVLSFHRLYIGITSVSLRPGASGMGYKATVAGDEKVIEMMDNNAISMTMWIAGNKDNAQTVYMTKDKVASNMMTVTARVQGMDVAQHSQTVLCAAVSVNLNGKTITSGEASYTLRQAVEAVAAAVKDGADYTDSQMSAIQEFCAKNREAMSGWANIDAILNWISNV